MYDTGMLSGLRGQGSYSHPNPMFNYVTGFIPRKIKDLFRWGEYLYYSSPHIWQAVTKLADYVITDVTYSTESSKVRKQYEAAFKSLEVMSHVKAAARDRMIYGNFFGSVYFPRVRWLMCESCKSLYNIESLPQDSVRYKIQKKVFEHDCPECGHTTRTATKSVRQMEREIKDLARANLIRWDPKHIDPEVNPVTGRTRYYYSIPSKFKSRVESNDRSIIDDSPVEYLEACKDGESFRFADDAIFHMRIDAPAGVDDDGWGFPPLTAVIKQFFYTEILRRANEAIALDHLVPFRVLHPVQGTQNANPVDKLDLARWVRNTKQGLKQHRNDPLHMSFAPIPVGVTQVGGQGRSMLTLGEVEMSENNIIAGMGIPREFLFGGLSYTGSSVTLRMLENQLLTHAKDLNKYLQWITDKIGAYMGWEVVEVQLVPFKFVDDMQQTSILMQLDQVYGFLSKAFWADRYDVDLDQEIERQQQEQLDATRQQIDTQAKLDQLQNSLAQQAQGAASTGAGLNYDQQAVIAEADGIAQQLMSVDEGTRRSNLSALQTEDMVMYSVVIQILEQYRTSQEAQIRAQMSAQ